MNHIFLLLTFMCQSLTVIFLDIDGVLIRDASLVRGKRAKLLEFFGDKKHYTPLEWSVATAYFFDTAAVHHLDQLIYQIEQSHPVGIVLSSAWRENGTLEETQTQMFAMWPFSHKIIDKTVHNRVLSSRADQIEHWLHNHEVTHFIILDDWDDGLSTRFEQHFVHVQNGVLSMPDVSLALHKLASTNKAMSNAAKILP